MLKLTNVKVSIDEDISLVALAARKLKLPEAVVSEVRIARQAVDARKKSHIMLVYTLHVKVAADEDKLLARGGPDISVAVADIAQPVETGAAVMQYPPLVIGAGPAGLIAALMLARFGYRPLLLERGRTIEQRALDIERFWQLGQLDEVSNVQFGEGGAGTFSDGKLTTRVNDAGISTVLSMLVEAGAPPEILYQHKPHIGTDRLRQVVANLRRNIIELGGQVRFECCVTDVDHDGQRIRGVTVNGNQYIPCDMAVLAIGHSARDTYAMLLGRHVAMQAKPFAIGLRIEHPQDMIDAAQYGSYAGHPKLGPADYALVYHDKPSGRTAYSFCMCPGGSVIAAASECGGVVTNGMSHYRRDSGVANSALVVNVSPADYGSGALDGVKFQRHYEQLAYQAGGGNYHAPVQKVSDFLAGKPGSGTSFLTEPTYRPGTQVSDLHQCLPGFVADTLVAALPDFQRRIQQFAHPDAMLTGVETRTSAPVRLLRNGSFESENVRGLYPIGEGSGYAGGIMSAALDGLNCVLNIIKTYKPV